MRSMKYSSHIKAAIAKPLLSYLKSQIKTSKEVIQNISEIISIPFLHKSLHRNRNHIITSIKHLSFSTDLC